MSFFQVMLSGLFWAIVFILITLAPSFLIIKLFFKVKKIKKRKKKRR